MFIFLMGGSVATKQPLSVRLRRMGIAFTVVAASIVVVVGTMLTVQSTQSPGVADMLRDQPTGPVPFPQAPGAPTAAQRAQVIAQTTQAGEQAERASRANGGAGSMQTQALHSWNAFFATHTGVKHVN